MGDRCGARSGPGGGGRPDGASASSGELFRRDGLDDRRGSYRRPRSNRRSIGSAPASSILDLGLPDVTASTSSASLRSRHELPGDRAVRPRRRVRPGAGPRVRRRRLRRQAVPQPRARRPGPGPAPPPPGRPTSPATRGRRRGSGGRSAEPGGRGRRRGRSHSLPRSSTCSSSSSVLAPAGLLPSQLLDRVWQRRTRTGRARTRSPSTSTGSARRSAATASSPSAAWATGSTPAPPIVGA